MPFDLNQILGAVFHQPLPVQIALIAGATIVQEDVTALALGAMLTANRAELPPVVIGLFAGAFVANLVFWGAGRALGPAAFQLPMLRKANANGTVDKAKRQFERSSLVALLVSRFIPGTRVPVCAIAGVLQMSLPRFALYSGMAVVPWIVLMLWIPDRLRWLAESGLLWWFLPVAAAAGIWYWWKGRKKS